MIAVANSLAFVAIICVLAILAAVATDSSVAGTRHVLKWCKTNGRSLFLISVAFFAGCLLMSVIGTEHASDATASLVGSFAGVAAAIGGALWVYELQESRAGVRVHTAVNNALGQLIDPVGSMYHYCTRVQKDDQECSQLRDAAENFCSAVENYQSRIARLEAQLMLLPSWLISPHAIIDLELKRALKRAQALLNLSILTLPLAREDISELTFHIMMFAEFGRMFDREFLSYVPGPVDQISNKTAAE